jgi:polyhydroxybutyrate depolymerase
MFPLLWLTACSSVGGGSATPDDTDSQVDPRFDPSTWPATLGPQDRPARLTTPKTWDGESLLPVILVLHGYGATGQVQEAYFGLPERVEAQGFVLLSPDGLVDRLGRRYWNATDACCDFSGSGVDDVGYLTGLLDELEQRVPIDRARVAVVGHSNGGFMAYRLACDAGDRFRAVVSLAGAFWSDPTQCGGTATPDVLQIHGTNDDTILYEGGDFGGVVFYPGALESATFWAERAQCGSGPAGDGRSDYVGSPQEETERQAWPCVDGRVGLWTLDGVGHIPMFNDAFKDDLITWVLAQ